MNGSTCMRVRTVDPEIFAIIAQDICDLRNINVK